MGEVERASRPPPCTVYGSWRWCKRRKQGDAWMQACSPSTRRRKGSGGEQMEIWKKPAIGGGEQKSLRSGSFEETHVASITITAYGPSASLPAGFSSPPAELSSRQTKNMQKPARMVAAAIAQTTAATGPGISAATRCENMTVRVVVRTHTAALTRRRLGDSAGNLSKTRRRWKRSTRSTKHTATNSTELGSCLEW